MIETGLYIHIPFCERRCNYCSFFSNIQNDDAINKYVNELTEEIKLVGKKNNSAEIKTIYLGGGTPSLLDLNRLEKIFNNIYKYFNINCTEITIEVNPNSSSNLKSYQQFGVNRISLGTQTANDFLLKKMGRLHTAQEGKKALENAAKYFQNVSADIILGLDEKQNPIEEINFVKDYVKHISAYMLTIEDGTPLANAINNKSVSIATEDTVISQYEEFDQYASEVGFKKYETSNFSLLGYESQHNSSYWNLTPYIGLGAGAHSYVNGRRYYNIPDLKQYLNKNHSGYGKELIERIASRQEDKLEYVMLALRTVNGISLSYYKNKFGSEFKNDFSQGLEKAKEYLWHNEKSVGILSKYFLVQNSVISLILTGTY